MGEEERYTRKMFISSTISQGHDSNFFSFVSFPSFVLLLVERSFLRSPLEYMKYEVDEESFLQEEGMKQKSSTRRRGEEV